MGSTRVLFQLFQSGNVHRNHHHLGHAALRHRLHQRHHFVFLLLSPDRQGFHRRAVSTLAKSSESVRTKSTAQASRFRFRPARASAAIQFGRYQTAGSAARNPSNWRSPSIVFDNQRTAGCHHQWRFSATRRCQSDRVRRRGRE